MRTLVDIEDKAISALDRIARDENVSRSALIREAVADLLKKRHSSDMQDAFGLWSKSSACQDGVEYQRLLREEW
ncbi:CopG family transcriptional regulator [Rhizobium sp. FKY42]|uniref:ribbon-helix-helix domain-containing protein n=1 Tax=Rhizobium sp. FKY42 TaxID=2562310 RepID=UPI0010C060EF|nr:CopG family transcriptional regulator [Rhizobium sp. FKY42]